MPNFPGTVLRTPAMPAEHFDCRPMPRPIFGLAALYVVMAVYLLLPHPQRFPTILVNVILFAAVQIVFPQLRPEWSQPISPRNTLVIAFFFTSVMLPLTLEFQGVHQHTLPYIPDDQAINRAILLSGLAYVAAAMGFSFGSKSNVRDSPWTLSGMGFEWLALGYLVIGLTGLFFAFGTPEALLTYYRDPGSLPAPTTDTSVISAAGTFFRPFLGFSFVLMWATYLAKAKEDSLVKKTVVSLLFLALIVGGYSTFGHNRAAFVIPAIAFAAAYSRTVRRLPVWLLSTVGLVLLNLMVLWGEYRSGPLPDGVQASETGGLIPLIQIYGNSQQFLAFVMTSGGHDLPLLLGKSLVASAVYPVPILGEPLREASGVTLYNGWIYGFGSGIEDQIIPFAGELFLNFSYPGVVIGFFLLGVFVAYLHGEFQRARGPLLVFIVQYVAVWTCFLVVGSLAAFAQILVFFFPPVYLAIVVGAGGSSKDSERGVSRGRYSEWSIR